MDRINKFIELKPTKKSRYIRHNKKDVLVTKKDITKIRTFRLNKCMDPSIDLYTGCDTSWSRKEAEHGIHVSKKRKNIVQTNNYIKRIIEESENKRPKKDPNAINDLWPDEDELDTNSFYRINKTKIPRKGIVGDISKHRFKNEHLNEALDSFDQHYFSPRIKECKIQDLLPKIPNKEEIKNIPEEIGKTYKFDDIIKEAYINNNDDIFGISFGFDASTFEFRNFKKNINLNSKDKKIQNLIVNENILIYSIYNKIFIRLNENNKKKSKCSNNDKICESEAENITNNVFKNSISNLVDENNNNFNSDSLKWSDVKKKDKSISRFIKKMDKNLIEIEHSNKIKKISISPNEKLLAVLTGKNVILHDIVNYKSIQPIKFKTEIPLFILQGNSKLSISTTNNYLEYDLKTRNFFLEFSSILSFPHKFSSNKLFTIIADKENRITIIYEGKIIKYMEQNKIVKNVIIHQKLDLFFVVFEESISLFYGKLNNISQEFECVVVKEYIGKYKNVQFHDSLPWIYASLKNKLLIFT